MGPKNDERVPPELVNFSCDPAGPALSPECSQKFTDLAEHKNQTFEKHQTRLSIYKEVQLHGELSGAISDG